MLHTLVQSPAFRLCPEQITASLAEGTVLSSPEPPYDVLVGCQSSNSCAMDTHCVSFSSTLKSQTAVLGALVGASLGASVSALVGASVGALVGASVGESLGALVCDSVNGLVAGVHRAAPPCCVASPAVNWHVPPTVVFFA